MRIGADALHEIAAGIVAAAGSDQDEAQCVAAHLVRANLCGHDSHGVGMLPAYMRSVERGLLSPNTEPRLVGGESAILRFAGGRGYGQRVARDAVARTVERAAEHGIACMTLAGAHHVGRIGTYGEQTLRAGFASLHFASVVDHAPLVAPHRGSDARFGTNPVCIAFPGGERHGPMLLDMATSKIALGKARVAMNEGVEAPVGALIDAAGDPTRDPSVMFRQPMGALLPFAEYKGYGLALAAELLAGVFSGGGTIQPGNERHDSIVNHMMSVVFDPARFGDPGWQRAETDATLDYVLASPPADAAEPVLKPGDPEAASEAERREKGIAIDETSWEEIVAAGESVGFGRSAIESIMGKGDPG